MGKRVFPPIFHHISNKMLIFAGEIMYQAHNQRSVSDKPTIQQHAKNKETETIQQSQNRLFPDTIKNIEH